MMGDDEDDDDGDDDEEDDEGEGDNNEHEDPEEFHREVEGDRRITALDPVLETSPKPIRGASYSYRSDVDVPLSTTWSRFPEQHKGLTPPTFHCGASPLPLESWTHDTVHGAPYQTSYTLDQPSLAATQGVDFLGATTNSSGLRANESYVAFGELTLARPYGCLSYLLTCWEPEMV